MIGLPSFVVVGRPSVLLVMQIQIIVVSVRQAGVILNHLACLVLQSCLELARGLIRAVRPNLISPSSLHLISHSDYLLGAVFLGH